MAKGVGERKDSVLLAIPTKDQLMHILGYLLDEEEFLSPYGIRSLSKVTLHFQQIPVFTVLCSSSH
jgi:hypothetical protein